MHKAINRDKARARCNPPLAAWISADQKLSEDHRPRLRDRAGDVDERIENRGASSLDAVSLKRKTEAKSAPSADEDSATATSASQRLMRC